MRPFARLRCLVAILPIILFAADVNAQGWAMGINPRNQSEFLEVTSISPGPVGWIYVVGSIEGSSFMTVVDSSGRGPTRFRIYEPEAGVRLRLTETATFPLAEGSIPFTAGFTAIGDWNNQGIVMRVDRNGFIAWHHRVGDLETRNGLVDVVTTEDGEIFVLGNTLSYPWLARRDPDTGEPIWDSTYHVQTADQAEWVHGTSVIPVAMTILSDGDSGDGYFHGGGYLVIRVHGEESAECQTYNVRPNLNAMAL